MSASYGSLQISYCEGSKLGNCGHTHAITVCGDHAKTSGALELLEIYGRMTPEERKALLEYVRMMPEERASIAELNAKLKKSKDLTKTVLEVLKMLKTEIYIEAGPNTPESKKVVKSTRNKGGKKSRENGNSEKNGKKNGKKSSENGNSEKNGKKNGKQPRKKANHPGTTDNRRASTSIHAVFKKCKCGSEMFKVDEKNTRTLDEILAVLTIIEQFSEIKGTCMGCGAKADGKLFKENAVNINAGDSNTAKSSEEIKVHDGMLGLLKPDAPDVAESQDLTPPAPPVPPPPDVEPKPDAPDVAESQDSTPPGTWVTTRYSWPVTSMIETQDPKPPTSPSNSKPRQNASKGKVWVKTESGMQTLLTEKAAAKQSGTVPDSIIRKGSIVKSSNTEGKTEIQIPKEGRKNFGILALIAILWGHRVTLGRVGEFISQLCGFGYSPSTIMNALKMMGTGLKPFTDDILAQLFKAPMVYIDETTFRVGKKLRYVWVITDGKLVYYFAHSRSVTKLIELFDGYEGVVGCDGYHTRKLFEVVQRCWAHILRTTKWGADFEKKYENSTVARDFHNAVRDVFHLAVSEKLEGRGTESYDMVLNKLQDIVKHYEQFPEIKKAVGHVRNAADQAFTFMKYDYASPTNNIAEQAMREIVKHRVMRVLFRTWEGMETFVTMMSVVETCRKCGIDIKSILRKYL